MLDCQAQGIEVSLSTLRGFVQSEEALNELSRLAAQYSDVNCTTEDINFIWNASPAAPRSRRRRPRCPMKT